MLINIDVKLVYLLFIRKIIDIERIFINIFGMSDIYLVKIRIFE
ncbi:hypothetical protein HMPREF0669_01965 (plasmid) [Prevotella sp. oral taxon 299 str. F0039]|jgi:hypothetical protein|nr:hypothetical protein HMPREF0669_01965 [Prevotella sp. oral taxon 299 str. F0039]